MKRMTHRLLAVAFAFGPTLSSEAAVRETAPHRQLAPAYVARSASITPEAGCVKACPFDDNPCDPPAYKHADGRCTGE